MDNILDGDLSGWRGVWWRVVNMESFLDRELPGMERFQDGKLPGLRVVMMNSYQDGDLSG